MEFFKKAVGDNPELAKVAGQKAGEFVEQKVQEVIGGKGNEEQQKPPQQKPPQQQQQQQQQKPPQQQQQQQQQKKEAEGCFGVDDVLTADGVKNIAGGLFK